ncbi:hypothetical protein NGA35_15580 [Pseudomonas stutzeri]|nr:hypothetical protein [Stutzerimonas stutzeri]
MNCLPGQRPGCSEPLVQVREQLLGEPDRGGMLASRNILLGGIAQLTGNQRAAIGKAQFRFGGILEQSMMDQRHALRSE